MENSPPPLIQQSYPSTPPSRRPTRWGLIIVSILLVLSVFVNFGMFGILAITGSHDHSDPGSFFKQRHVSGPRDGDGKIAVVRLEGVISYSINGHIGHDGMVGDIKEQLELATRDESIKAIILKIDSPGGEVLASDDIYRAVLKADKVKPVVCCMGSIAASGGYYSAMGSRWIVADPLTITGSIGVIMETMNYKDLTEKIGVKFHVFKSGKFKDIMSGSRDPQPEEIELIQNLIMETYDQFVGIVAEKRKIDLELLKSTLADGRIFSGKQAKEKGLVNSLGTFEDAVKKAQEFGGISDAEVVEYIAPFSLGELFGFMGKSEAPKIELNVLPQKIKIEQGKMYYLSTHLF